MGVFNADKCQKEFMRIQSSAAMYPGGGGGGGAGSKRGSSSDVGGISSYYARKRARGGNSRDIGEFGALATVWRCMVWFPCPFLKGGCGQVLGTREKKKSETGI